MKSFLGLLLSVSLVFAVNAQALVRGGAQSGSKVNVLASSTTNTANRALRAQYIKKMGGIVHLPASGSVLLIVDATSKLVGEASYAEVEKVMREYDMVALRMEQDAKAGDKISASSAFDFAKTKSSGAAGVVLLFNGGMKAPVLATYPEDRIAVLNVDALCTGAKGSGIREDRVTREIWRAIGFTFGSGYAQQFECVMKPISTMDELDSMKLKFLHPQSAFSMREAFKKAGAIPARHGTYVQAVRGGWAPMPTNEIQRAIWEKSSK